mgnify:CR=1 FL=1
MLATAEPKAADHLHSDAENSLRQRAKDLLELEIEFIDNASFRKAAVRKEILTTEISCDAASATRSSADNELPAHLARLCDAELLTKEQEQELFRRMNFFKYRANVLRAKLDLDDPQESEIREIENLLQNAKDLRDHIIQANMRLVISIVKKFVSPSFSFDELLSDGIVILMNAVEKFDYDRGFRFSTYAYRSIMRNAYRKVMDRKKDQARYAAVAEETIEGSVDEGSTASMDEKTWERLRGMLAKFLGNLDKRERLIVRSRYALGQFRTIQTFQSIADKLGVSKERVRQLEQRAVGKLQAMAAEANAEPGV